MFKSDKFATSTVLTEACAQMSVILVCYLRDVVSAVLCYGNVAGRLAGWLAGCHTPVLYKNS